MKTVLLLGLNARYTHTNPALYYLRRYCRDLPYRFLIREYSINRRAVEIHREIAAVKPDILGISAYIWNSTLVKALLPAIKRSLPRCVIVLGGPEVSYNTGQWISGFSEIDHIVAGAGEQGFFDLLNHDFPSDEKIISRENPPFSEIPFPYEDADFEGFRNRYIYYESSRGCPFKCSYCLSSRTDHPLQHRDPARVQSELSYLISKKPDLVKFVDRSFNADRGFAREIWHFLIGQNRTSRFHFEVHPTLLHDEDFDVIAQAPRGYFQFEIGIQSANERTLEEIRRPGDREAIRRNVLRLTCMGTIRTHVDMIAGLPFEDMGSLEKSFNEIYSMGADYFQLGFLKVLPGTDIDAGKDEYGITHTADPPYRILSNRWLSAMEMEELERIEAMLNRCYNFSRMDSALDLLERLHESPFALYRSLARWWKERNLNHHKRDWPYIVRGLNGYINEVHPSHSDDFRTRLDDDLKTAGR